MSAPSTTWQNGGNSFWNIDGNWTSGTPTATTNACIVNGTSTVTLNTNGNANGIQLAGGNILNIFGGSLSIAGTSLNYGGIGIIGVLSNNSGAYFTNNGAISGGAGSVTPGSLYNSGTFLNNSNMFLLGFVLNNVGNFANSGTIVEEAGQLTNGGTFKNAGTITLHTGDDPIQFINSGTFNNSGTMNVFFDNFTVNSFSNNSKLNDSGTLTVKSDLPVGQPATMSNSVTITNTGTFNLTTSLGASFSNSGTINNTGALNIAQIPPNLEGNNMGGSFGNSGTLSNSGTISNSGVFTNSGSVLINGGLFITSTKYTQTAGSTLVDGTLTATGGAIVDIESGKLGGTGTINGDVLMKGIISPDSSGVPGTFTINGNYEQTSTGVFDELISGASSNGLLDVTGVLALDPGSLLQITLQGGFNPVGDSFTILDYGSLAGFFSNGTTFFADGFQWTLSYGPNDAVLTAVSTPESSAMPLIAIGFLALLGFAAKRAAAL